ncbi:MAG TPA: Stp1/IreP family PP2C-type Ser/Thr phosphatase [Ktedonobacteraceae bacterium]|jgi:protein phosphatase
MRCPSASHADTLSLRLYRFLLLVYPRAFREEYASEMVLLFRDVYYETSQQQGMPGVLRLWGDVFYDLVKTVCIEHIRNWIYHNEREIALAGKEQLAMTLPFTLDIAQRTDIGLKRDDNEDNLISIVPEDRQLLQAKGALFVVSDGMGGHDRGEVASELTVQKIKHYYYQDLEHDIPNALQEAIKQANNAIYQINEQEPAPEGKSLNMGATCVAAVLHDQTLYAANVGDSRVYVLHEGQLRQVTRDHSVTALMVERGEITPAEARTHEKRNVIYRSLGLAEVEVDLFTESVQEGDTLILCTDGLCGVVEDEELRTIVEQYSPEESVQHLIARANEAGGPDNVTAIVVRVSAT